MDRFLVRKSGPRCVEPEVSAKRPRADVPRSEGAHTEKALCEGIEALGDPRILVSWNVNGLGTQLRDEWSTIRAFLERERPDVLFLQEVRLSAAGPRGSKRGDGQKRKRCTAKRETKQEVETWQLVEKTLLKSTREDYVVYWSLADWKYSGTALLVRRALQPSVVTYTLPALAATGHAGHLDPADPRWHPDGRLIFASFKTFDLLATYAPNNGTDEASFARRAAWDEALRVELTRRRRPLLWIGDLNCALDEVDVSHPEWFAQQMVESVDPDMRGQPGFTLGERRRFRQLLEEGRLVDAYRRLHPVEGVPPAGGPHFTWRGSPPARQFAAKYHGKAMRIDYTLVSEELMPRVEEASILGHGADRHGFMGSDHAPIRLTLGASTVTEPVATLAPTAHAPTAEACIEV